MSGGSYDYLCFKEIDDIVKEESILQEMADDLAKLGYASDAARETEEFLLTLRQFKNRLKSMKDRMEPIWKAMEWWQSSDWSEDQFKKSLNEYRGEKTE